LAKADGRSALDVESHSIEFVPLTERYGSPARLFTIWFGINVSIVCAAVGTLGIASGLSLSWVIAALALGNAIGTVFMAAHSAQGPHLGIPQMIQSRAQFGVLGAAVPLVAVVVTYILYTAADGLVVEGTISSLFSIRDNTSVILFGLVTLVVAYVGYELIHRIAALLSVLSAVLFVIVTVAYLVKARAISHAVVPTGNGLDVKIFTATVTQAAAWTLSFGPYVADYSRYLSAKVPTSTTFWYTAGGCFLGATLTMAFGAYLASVDLEGTADLGAAVVAVFPWGKAPVRLIIAMAVLVGNVMNVYSAYMSTTTIFAGLRDMRTVSKSTKLITMTLVIAAATAIAIWAQGHFDKYFGDTLSVMIYLLVPWSAINLADYYIVRKGRYDIEDMYRLHGRYGVFRWWTILTYLGSVLVEVPFMDLTDFKGGIARAIDVDVAWLPGLITAGLLYVAVERWRAA
jgi:NCS1 family nucleobase:cation symporter-1